MPALRYLYQMLSTFRHLFARHLPWTMFCAVILGFIGSHHVEAMSVPHTRRGFRAPLPIMSQIFFF